MLSSENLSKNRKVYISLAILVILGLFAFRVVDLEKDLPAWGIAFYQPIDEGAYSNMAINYKVFGSINPTAEETGGPETLLTGNFLTNLLGNLLTIAGFSIFGNNYYGLRMGYVFISLINLVCFFITLNCIRRKYAGSSHSAITVILAFLLWFVLDFSFLVNSRVAEPSSSRLLFVQLITIAFISGRDESIWKYAVMGFLTTVSVFLIYITNVFLYLACGFTLLLGWKKYGSKVFWKQVGAFVAGTLVAFALAEVYYIVGFGTEAVYNTLSTVIAFGSNPDSASAFTESSGNLWEAFNTVRITWLNYFSSNSFIYNLPTVALFLLMVPMAIRLTVKEKSLDIFFLHMIVFCFFLQTFISSDCITRKLILIFPAVMALIYIYILRRQEILQMILHLSPVAVGKKQLSRNALLALRWIVGIIWLVITLATVIGVMHYRLFVFDQTSQDYGPLSTLVLVVFGFVPTMAAFVIIAGSLIRHTVQKKGYDDKPFNMMPLLKRTAICLLIAMLLCNTVFSVRYVWLNDSHTERDAMISMKDIVKDRYVFGGGYQLGYSLYNEMLPIVSDREHTVDFLLEYEESINLDYEFTEEALRGVMQYLYDGHERIDFHKIETYTRAFGTFGVSRSITLYDAVPAATGE